MGPSLMRHVFRATEYALLMTVVAGCGSRFQTPAELAEAHGAVQTALDAWVRGDPGTDMRSDGRAVELTDQDWKMGQRLVGYKILREEGLKGDHARIWVLLSLRDPAGKTGEKEVAYEIARTDKFVIARDPFN